MTIQRKSKSFFQNNHFQLVLRIVLGLLFLIAGLTKVFDIQAFVQAIEDYDMIHYSLQTPLAMLISYGEVTLGMMLLLSFYQRIAFASGGVLILLFSGVSLYYHMKTGNAVDCGCFGKLLARQNNWQLFVENAVILTALLIGWKISGYPERNAAPKQQ